MQGVPGVIRPVAVPVDVAAAVELRVVVLKVVFVVVVEAFVVEEVVFLVVEVCVLFDHEVVEVEVVLEVVVVA